MVLLILCVFVPLSIYHYYYIFGFLQNKRAQAPDTKLELNCSLLPNLNA